MQLVQFIKECRQAKAWRQSEMADQMGISTQAISNIERGVMKPPIHFLIKFCKVFDVPEDKVQELFVAYQMDVAEKESAEKWKKAVVTKSIKELQKSPIIWN
ncbi:helix-turn-helix domain-containing protein [Bdellovibrio bacteriovorus]|nr:helix-turn-helix transcriptional regulator [Bdellovibrio bacteriovorus]